MPPRQRNSLEINVRGGTLFVDGSAVTTVYDMRGNTWFKANDIASALGYSNTSNSVLHRVSASEKMKYNDIYLHERSPQHSADPRNVFINQSGLISFLLDCCPSCVTHQIQKMALPSKINLPVTALRTNLKAPAATPSVIPTVSCIKPNQRISGGAFMINGRPITIIVDTEKHAWFRMIDVSDALGFANIHTSVSQHVSDQDKAPLKDIAIHKDSLVTDADPRNIFINQQGLTDVLLVKRRKPQVTQVNTSFCTDDPVNLNVYDKLVLKPIYRCIRDLKTLPNIVSDCPTSNINMPSSGVKTSTNSTITLMPKPPLQSTISSARKLSYEACAPVNICDSSSADDGRMSVIKICNSSAGYTIKVDVSSDSGLIWSQQVHSAREVLKLIEHFLSDWISDDHSYNLPGKQLVRAVSTICSNFEKTLKMVKESTSNIDVSRQPSKDLQPMSKDQLDYLTRSLECPVEWIYIASSIPYARKNVFKVGSTEDRLSKRLAQYQTGRIAEDRYHYFQVFRVHNSKKIDKLIGFFLRPWSEAGERRQTEVYKLDFTTLSNIVRGIINYYEECYRCILEIK